MASKFFKPEKNLVRSMIVIMISSWSYPLGWVVIIIVSWANGK